MEARITEREAFRIIGVQIRDSPTKADYQDLWHNRYMPRMAEINSLGYGHECYGAYFATDQDGINDIIAGKAVAEDVIPPEGLVARDVPAATYAVFDCRVNSIGPTWQAIFAQWLPMSGHQLDTGKAALEVYPPGETEDHATAPVEIWLPISRG